MVNPSDIIALEEYVSPILAEAKEILEKCPEEMRDRPDLHKRRDVERKFNKLIGFLAEQGVCSWLKSQGIACSCVHEAIPCGGGPDLGYDLEVKGKNGLVCTISVKSSVYRCSESERYPWDSILKSRRMAVTRIEATKADYHVQVFWIKHLDKDIPLKTLTFEDKNGEKANFSVGIVAWGSRSTILRCKFAPLSKAKGENREVPTKKLGDFEPMKKLLRMLKTVGC